MTAPTAPTAPGAGSGIDLRSFVHLLRRRWSFLVLVAVLAAATAYGSASLQTERYSATSQLLISPQLAQTLLGSGSASDVQQELSTELVLVESREVRTTFQERLGTPMEVDVAAVEDSQIIEITAESPNPELAALAANTYAETFVQLRQASSAQQIADATLELDRSITELDSQIEAIEAQLVDNTFNESLTAQRDALIEQRISDQLRRDDLRQELTVRTGGAQVASTAEVPVEPFEPTPLPDALTAGVLGLLVAAAAVALASYLDDTITTPAELEEVLDGVPLLAAIPRVARSLPTDPALVSHAVPHAPAAEAYRTVRTAIQFASVSSPIRSVLVVSAVPEEGKTTTAVNLAVVFAQAGQRVVLVDADLRRPRVDQLVVNGRRSPGLVEAITDQVPPHDTIVRPPDMENLAVMTSGRVPSNPSELVGSRKFGQLVTELTEQVDLVVIDSPPLLRVTDALILSSQVDAVVLVVGAGTATRRTVTGSLTALGQVSAPLLGVVINGSTDGGGFGYGYGYARDDTEERPAAPTTDEARMEQQRLRLGRASG